MKRIIQQLIRAGASKAPNSGQAEKVVILNKCLYTGLLLFIPNTLYEMSLGLPYTVLCDLGFIAAVVAALLLNRYGCYFKARNLSITAANIVILLGNYVEGTAAANYIIYLPLIVLFSVLMKAREEKRAAFLLLSITLVCIILCFLICPQKSTTQYISEDSLKTMFYGNVALSFILIFVFTYQVSMVTLDGEKQLLKAKEVAEEGARSKSMFLSNMSHELRTPLNGIIGTSNLLLEEDHLPAQKEHLAVLKYSSEHMLTLVNDILDFNKIEAGKIGLLQTPVNLLWLLKQTEAVFAKQFEQKQIAFTVVKDPALDMLVLTDDTRLTQVLNNLLGNALKFTHKGGVTLTANITALKSDMVTVHFSVTDTGIGIAAGKLNAIFDSFTLADSKTTRQYGGTGLGLSISKKIVQAFNGDLLANSQPGQGSSFYFTLSFVRSKLQSLSLPEKKKVKLEPMPGLRLLIAEDNVINMKVARKFLQNWEVNIQEAVNGVEAVALCRDNHFDLLLLDLEMPEMDGHTALTEIRKFNPAIPAIAFTAAMYPNIKEQLAEKGFNDFVSKPFRPEDLYNKIKQFQRQTAE
jgi:signal transduction histidine kinase/CheY-like chemotaxis protein